MSSIDFKDKLRQPLYDTVRYSPGMCHQLSRGQQVTRRET